MHARLSLVDHKTHLTRDREVDDDKGGKLVQVDSACASNTCDWPPRDGSPGWSDIQQTWRKVDTAAAGFRDIEDACPDCQKALDTAANVDL